MKKPSKYLLGFFIFIGYFLFIYGVVLACVQSWVEDRPEYKSPVFLTTIVTSIWTLLATIMLAIHEISITKSNTGLNETEARNLHSNFKNLDPTDNKAMTFNIKCAFINQELERYFEEALKVPKNELKKN